MQTITKPANELLSADEVLQVEASSDALAKLIGVDDDQKSSLRVSIECADGRKAEMLLPGKTLATLKQMLRELGRGKNVAVLSTDSEVTTQQAAGFLMISRPYFVKLLETGKIPFRKVGPRRRVLLGDLLRYRELEEAERHRGLDELVADAEKLGMY